MRRRPFRPACCRLEQLALQIRSENLPNCAVTLWQSLYVFGYCVPDFGALQHSPENAGFHVHGPARYASRQPPGLIPRNVFGLKAKQRLFAEVPAKRSETFFLELHRSL
jgi:hypothetical protein